MSEENKVPKSDSFFKSKHFLSSTIASIVIVAIIAVLTFRNVEVSTRWQAISDNLFAIAAMFFIFAVFAASRAWSLFKRGIKNHNDELVVKSRKSKFFAKILGFIGLVNLIFSIIALIIVL